MIIVIPKTVKIIEEAQKETFKSSVKELMNIVSMKQQEYLIDKHSMETMEFYYNNSLESSNMEGLSLDYKGQKPQFGVIIINKASEIALALHNGKYCLEKGYEEENIFITTKGLEDCSIPTLVDVSGANKPILSTGMEPVIWKENEEGNGGNWIVASNIDNPYHQNWYDYENKKWANARTKDGSMWVWIPRYAYKIIEGYSQSNTSGLVDVIFLRGTTNNSLNNTKIETRGYEVGVKDTSMHYFLHPAFIFGDDISGFWVAKFLPSKLDNEIKIVPNASIWGNIYLRDAFSKSRAMETKTDLYGWLLNEVDTHMMKNIEWGAIAYLCKSQYGVQQKIISPNAFSQNKTGCSSKTNDCMEYDTEGGIKGSTTGNIYGVYDMSGGARERTSAYINADYYYLEYYGKVILEADNKYKDIYEISENNDQMGNYIINKNKYGDAIFEISGSTGTGTSIGWDNAAAKMPSSSSYWFLRGGSSSTASLFSFEGSNGDNSGVNLLDSFRPIVILKGVNNS